MNHPTPEMKRKFTRDSRDAARFNVLRHLRAAALCLKATHEIDPLPSQHMYADREVSNSVFTALFDYFDVFDKNIANELREIHEYWQVCRNAR
jgi:hypothetical protein